jgi:hypothetical protein
MKGMFGYRLLLIALLAMPAALVRGQQFGIVPLVVSPIYLKSQLWNVSISNTGAPAEVRLQLDMKDIQTHQSVLSAASGAFRVQKGASIMQQAALEPITYVYNSPVVVDRTPSGPLPVGQYQVCYELLLISGETQGVIAEDCEEIAVEPLSPPVLTMPEDDSLVSVTQPNFMWLPPTPVTMFSNLTYDIIIAEVADGQSLSDAIQKNLPVQQAQGLQQPFLTYPMTGPQLDTGKTYAWQVVAMDGSQYAAKSDVWSFRTGLKKLSAELNTSKYILMDGHASGVGYADSAMLYLKYVSSAAVNQATVQVKDMRGSVLMMTTCIVKQGDNYLNIPLSGNFEQKQKYIAVLTDKSGRETAVTFTIK